MRQKIIERVRRFLGNEGLSSELASLRAQIDELRPKGDGSNFNHPVSGFVDQSQTFPLSDWWKPGFWEPTVALAIRDYCRPGDVVFDVGTNAGGLALMMSRLVGPRGIVLAFEASPRIIDKTHFNLVKAGCHNVTLFHKAVWHRSGDLVNMSPGDHLNDRIQEGSSAGMTVRTVALDDLAAAGDFRPSFIKMDIEGAEFDALQGMKRLLADVRPALALEQSPDDMRCHALLTESGYRAVDLATYRQIRNESDFDRKSGVANVLFVPQESSEDSPYFSDVSPIKIVDLTWDTFRRSENGDITLKVPLEVSAGRYLCRAKFSAQGRDNEVFAGIEVDGEVVFRYHTYTALMADSYSDWVVHLERPGRIAPYLRFIVGSDDTLQWNGVDVFRLPSFDGFSRGIIE
jgi:FkbM family methyltransferase